MVLDLQNSSQIVRNKGEIERKKKKPPRKMCTRWVTDEREKNKELIYPVFFRKTWYVKHKYLICYISILERISISTWFVNLKEKKKTCYA